MRGSNNNYTHAEWKAERLDGTLYLAWVFWSWSFLMSYFVPKNCDRPLCIFSPLDRPYRSLCHIEANVRCWCSLPLAALFPIISWHLFFQAIDLGRFPFASQLTAHGLGCVSGGKVVIGLGHKGKYWVWLSPSAAHCNSQYVFPIKMSCPQ